MSVVHKDSVGLLAEKLAEYTAKYNLTPGVFVLEDNREAGPVIDVASSALGGRSAK